MNKIIRKMRKLRKEIRGVSPVVAVVLLIGLAVFAAAALFFIVQNILTPTGGLSVEVGAWDDTNNNGVYDQVRIGLKNEATSLLQVTAIKVQTSLDGSTWVDASLTNPPSFPIDIEGGRSSTITVSFVPTQNHFTTAQKVYYRVLADYKKSGSETVKESASASQTKDFGGVKDLVIVQITGKYVIGSSYDGFNFTVKNNWEGNLSFATTGNGQRGFDTNYASTDTVFTFVSGSEVTSDTDNDNGGNAPTDHYFRMINGLVYTSQQYTVPLAPGTTEFYGEIGGTYSGSGATTWIDIGVYIAFGDKVFYFTSGAVKVTGIPTG